MLSGDGGLALLALGVVLGAGLAVLLILAILTFGIATIWRGHKRAVLRSRLESS
jgi:hypothetical protein